MRRGLLDYELMFLFRIFCSCSLFNQCPVYIILIGPHLHLHRCGIIAQLQMPEMIKEDQYAEADPDGVGNLQDGKAGGTFSRNKSVKLAQKGCP